LEEEMSESKDQLIASLQEANEMLGEDNARYRRSNALLRRINSDLRRMQAIQHENDEAFKAMCQNDISEFTNVVDSEGGLPEESLSQA
jgi:hypothetical protein